MTMQGFLAGSAFWVLFTWAAYNAGVTDGRQQVADGSVMCRTVAHVHKVEYPCEWVEDQR
mgnify:CR=1 FL=1